MAPSRAGRPSKTRRAKKARIVVVGFGRLGGALSLSLTRAGWNVSVLPRSDESSQKARKLSVKLADESELRMADLVLLAVPDSVVGRLSAKLRDQLKPTAALVHCAGALDLSAFGTDPEMLRRPRGSFHPLCAVSAPQDDLSGHAVAVAASDRALLLQLEKMARALGMTPIEVPEARRSVYHAGAVMASGLLVALLSASAEAFEEAGIPQQAALESLLPLVRSALRGVEQRGLERGLTGPVARGDVSVIQQHLSALPTHLSAIYRVLSLRALKLVEEKLPPETRNALERLLQG